MQTEFMAELIYDERLERLAALVSGTNGIATPQRHITGDPP